MDWAEKIALYMRMHDLAKPDLAWILGTSRRTVYRWLGRNSRPKGTCAMVLLVMFARDGIIDQGEADLARVHFTPLMETLGVPWQGKG